MQGDVFRFKGFKVHQGACTMRVNTDGVLLGAWSDMSGKKRILDVGTGTGVIAMMAAYRNPDAEVTAIDIDQTAADTAYFNFSQSPFSTRLSALHCSVQDFVKACHQKFDLVISNPPFFTNGTRPGHAGKALARHAQQLPHDTLIDTALNLLSPEGHLDVILPYAESIIFQKAALEKKLYPEKITYVQTKAGRPVERSLMRLGLTEKTLIEDSLTIHDVNQPDKYTDRYVGLTKDFYLFM